MSVFMALKIAIIGCILYFFICFLLYLDNLYKHKDEDEKKKEEDNKKQKKGD